MFPNKLFHSIMKPLLKLLLAFLIIIYSSNAQFYWEQITNVPAPYNTNYWLEIYALPSNPNYMWVCGFNGMTLRTVDGGKTWNGSTVTGAYHLESIQFVTPLIGYTSGTDGIFKSINGGVTWTNITPYGSQNGWGLYFLDANTGVYLAGGCEDYQEFWKTTNGGINWSVYIDSLANSGLADAVLYPDGTGYVSSSGHIWKTTNTGSTWSVYANCGTNIWQEDIQKSTNSFLVPFSGYTCEGSGDIGGMRFSTDDGASWLQYVVNAPMFGTFLLDDKKGWACGYYQSVYYTSDAGHNWELKNCGIDSGNLDDMWFINDSTGWVVGEGIYKLSPAKLTADVSSLDFGNLCYPDTSFLGFNIDWLSFSSGIVSLDIQGTNANCFSIYKPSKSFQINSCDNDTITIRFIPDSYGTKVADLNIYVAGNLKITIPLTGSAVQTSLIPLDTLIIINPAYCGSNNSCSNSWSSSFTYEAINSSYRISGANDIQVGSTLPLNAVVGITKLYYNANPIDTGWSEERFRITTTPCSHDTTITVKEYGISPIISGNSNYNHSNKCESSYESKVPIFSTGNADLIISNADFVLDNTHFAIKGWTSNKTYPITIKVGGNDTLIYTFTPDIAKSYTSMLRIFNNDLTKSYGSKSPYLINITESYGNSTVSIKDSVINFGWVCLGQSKDTTTKLINTGNLDAKVQKPNNNNSTYDISIQSNVYPVTLPGNDVIPCTINFKPIQAGVFYDTIYIATLPCNDTTRIILIGTAYEDKIEIKPNSISENILSNQIIQKQLKIKSLSNDTISVTNIQLNPKPDNITFNFTPILPTFLNPSDTISYLLEFSSSVDTSYSGELCLTIDAKCPFDTCIPISLFIQSRKVTVIPDSVNFGSELCYITKQYDTVFVKNEASINDTITTIEINPSNIPFTITNMPALPCKISNFSTLSFIIESNIITEGIYSATLTIKTQDPDSQEFYIPIFAEYKKTNTASNDTIINFGIHEPCDSSLIATAKYYNSGLLNDTIVFDTATYNGFEFLPKDTLLVDSKDSNICNIKVIPSNLTIGKYQFIKKWHSIVCGSSGTITVNVEIIRPKLTISPTKLNFDAIWIGNSSSKYITIRNLTSIARHITNIELVCDSGNFAYNLNYKKDYNSNDVDSVMVTFLAEKKGNYNCSLIIYEESVCKDTSTIALSAVVPDEIYYATVRLGEYIGVAGKDLDIFMSLDTALPQITLNEADFTISFDKQLYLPSDVSVLDFDHYEPISYGYSNGVLTGKIPQNLAEYLFQRSGNFLKISGKVYFSYPDSTPLWINKFDIQSSKNIIINKVDGYLKLNQTCITSAILGIIEIPQLSVTFTNQVIDNNQLFFNINSTGKQILYVAISNLVGRKLIEYSYPIDKESKDLNLVLNDLSSGTYILTITSSNNHFYRNRFMLIK